MTGSCSRRHCGFFVFIAMATGCACQAAEPSQKQTDRAATIRAVVNRATRHWENPIYPHTVTLNGPSRPPRNDLELIRSGATGTYTERTRGGDHVGSGTWTFDTGGSGHLTWQPAGRTRAVLVGDDLLALQPLTAKGGLHGDGLVLFRAKYDFEGLGTQAILSAKQHQQRIRGRWTHPNLDTVHEVTDEGLWLERRKIGGIQNSGTWQIHDDGTYFVELDNRWRIRVWPMRNDQLAIVWFNHEGAMSGDGAILSRE